MAKSKPGQVEQILKELGKKIDILITDAKEAKDDIRDDVEEKIADLKKRKEKIEAEVEDFKHENDGKWSEIKLHLQRAADEIKRAAEAAFKKE